MPKLAIDRHASRGCKVHFGDAAGSILQWKGPPSLLSSLLLSLPPLALSRWLAIYLSISLSPHNNETR